MAHEFLLPPAWSGKISLDFLRLYSYNYSDMAKLRNRQAIRRPVNRAAIALGTVGLLAAGLLRGGVISIQRSVNSNEPVSLPPTGVLREGNGFILYIRVSIG